MTRARVRFCWVPSHCGIDGNERVDQIAKETLDQDIGPLASVHYTDMKPLVNSYIQKLVQTKWDAAVHGRDLLSCETNTGATEEVPAPNLSWSGCNHPTSNWPYQGHQILYLVPRTTNWLPPLWSNTDHWPYAAVVCIVTGGCDEYYTVDSLNTLSETNPETCIVEFLGEAGFFYLIWCN